MIYVMLDLRKRGQDIRKFIEMLELWMIRVLNSLSLDARTYPDRVGLWVKSDQVNQYAESKISAIGIRLRKWVSFHGLSLNIAPNLAHFDGIIPCGISNHGVTSLNQFGINVPVAEIDARLKQEFELVFSQVKDINFENF